LDVQKNKEILGTDKDKDNVKKADVNKDSEGITKIGIFKLSLLKIKINIVVFNY